MKEIIQTEHAPHAIGPYSQAIKSNGLIFASGQIPTDPYTGQFVPGGMAAAPQSSPSSGPSVSETPQVGMVPISSIAPAPKPAAKAEEVGSFGD